MDAAVRYLSQLLAQLVFLGRAEDSERIAQLSRLLHSIKPV